MGEQKSPQGHAWLSECKTTKAKIKEVAKKEKSEVTADECGAWTYAFFTQIMVLKRPGMLPYAQVPSRREEL